MTRRRRAIYLTSCAALVVALAWALLQPGGGPRFLHASRGDFVALFTPPPAADSVQTRDEIEQLLDLQRRRSPANVAAARADRKTEIVQFAAALGLEPAQMRGLRELDALAEQVEDDLRPYVRAAKYNFTRLRPYEVEARLSPCIDDVRGDLSYPSGHATFGYVMAYLLAEMVPERQAALLARAEEFARQRMVCGVHFPSDIEAGRRGAEWLVHQFLMSDAYQTAALAARRELRGALGLVSPEQAPGS